ncbi:MAG TPA: hypothetical protein PLF13_09550 [candidate division Zixibacteria bacterium]|nr:hypothetical protein [candidate division Zixibacteria bacterium]
MALQFSKSTDSEQEIKLDSYLISVMFNAARAVPGENLPFEVLTAFVGDGCPIKVKAKAEQGGSPGQVEGRMQGNRFVGEIMVPEDTEAGDKIYLEVKLSKVGLEGESARILVMPRIRVTELHWSAQEARRGDTLTLSANITGVRDGNEVTITIYEHDQDSAHDRITQFPTTVRGGSIAARWQYEYHEDTDELATQEELDNYGGSYNPPEYFFTIKVFAAEFGLGQESGLLTFKDYAELLGEDAFGSPLRNGEYIMKLADGSERRGQLNEDGYARVEDLPPGGYEVEFNAADDDDSTQTPDSSSGGGTQSSGGGDSQRS